MKVKINGVEHETPVYFKKKNANCTEYFAYIGSRVISIILFEGLEYNFNCDMYYLKHAPSFHPDAQITEQEFITAYSEMTKRFPRFLGMNKIDGITQ